MIWKYSLSSLLNFINSVHIYVTADESNFSTYSRVLKFVNLSIMDFDTSSPISTPLFHPICDWFWPTEMRPRGRRVCFPQSCVIAQITGTSVKLCIKWGWFLCASWNKTLLLMFLLLSKSTCILLKINFHVFWSNFIFLLLVFHKCLETNKSVKLKMDSCVWQDTTALIIL